MKNSEQLLYILQKITCLERGEIIKRLKSVKLSSDSLLQFAEHTGRLPDDDEAAFVKNLGVVLYCDLWNRGFVPKRRESLPSREEIYAVGNTKNSF